MERDRPRSLTPQSQRSSQRKHGLKMQTLPLPDELKPRESVRTTQEDDLAKDLEEFQSEPPHSSFERDEDFKFKRHKHRQNAGTASLGERLDNIQELQNARWMDNFNSSANLGRPPRNAHREQSSQESLQRHRQQQQQQQSSLMPMQAPPYMPFMYYYPYAPPMMQQMPTSPVRPADQDMPQFVNSSQGYPNTSTQPFLPPLPPQNSQLMPPPPLYPNYSGYNYYNDMQSSLAQKSKQRREKRSSLMAQRGRRLSLLSIQDNSHIISPHKDVPEHDFYRHIANTSFGQDLQIRQLFSWCFIRCLRKWEQREHRGSPQKPDSQGEAYVDPKRIALVIIKEIVDELRKGKIDVNWDVEDSADSALDDNSRYQEEDTELRALFDDDEEDEEGGGQVVRKRQKKGVRKQLIKLPNEKNVQNAKNLEVLQKQIDTLDGEIKKWIHELDDPGKTTEWEQFGGKLNELRQDLRQSPAADDPAQDPVPELERKLRLRMERLYATSHILHSNSKLLSKSSQRKLRDLTHFINQNVFTSQTATTPAQQPRKETKSLLVGLSRLLARPQT
ncbi:LAME_0H17744g1_1 [Lachancea meyersii CBS 8951]|uniref:LAME_0H17744g1_1 n=1 Tax=Lachancea meyersii CBS 8951 TaxID=1266667 RepID=A0A1G4KIG7_9SACH|nr:LAME_0H17744g1_1 [Lachancea meyersii CBS 8951]